LELGSINYPAVLAAEQAWQQALINLAQARANRFADSAALFMALGGGWWNRSETQAAQRELPLMGVLGAFTFSM
jgi:outer membrane protein TolC